MEKKGKKNIYETVSEVGKRVRKYGGYLLAFGGTYLVTKLPKIIKKIK